MDLEKEIRKYVLSNAIKYDGKASQGSVIGQLLGQHPELKAKFKEVAPLVGKTISEVNKLGLEKQTEELQTLAPELLVHKKKVARKLELKALPNAIDGSVVTRTAPNPNGAMHLGNARAAVLSFLYAEKYHGKFILRFDDTSPKTKRSKIEAYKWVQEDLEWLGAKIDKIHYACKNFERYYEIAEKLIGMGQAYICNCDTEEWREKKNKGIACPCRELPPKEQMERWKKMFTVYKENEVVLRIKTDLQHKDSGRRDWWAAKVIENPNHPITKNKYRVWPSYNLQSAIDDHDLGMTHILRGQEHSQNEYRQKYVYDYLGWEYPTAIHHGRVILPEGGLSTSKTSELINKGEYSGWDDPRLITLKAMRRRGFLPEAIKDIEISVGINTNDVILSFDKIASFNRTYIDKTADRYMFVEDPVKITIKGAPKIIAEVRFHPEKDKVRKIETNGVFYITKADSKKLEKGKLYRLMDCLNFIDSTYESVGIEDYRKKGRGIFHWVTTKNKIEVLMPNNTTTKGYGEDALRNIKIGEVIQFNRFGFCKKEAQGKYIFTHD